MQLINETEALKKYRDVLIQGETPEETTAIIVRVKDVANYNLRNAPEGKMWRATSAEVSSDLGRHTICRVDQTYYDEGNIKQITLEVEDKQSKNRHKRVISYNESEEIKSDFIRVSSEDNVEIFNKTNLEGGPYISSSNNEAYLGPVKEDSILAQISGFIEKAEALAIGDEPKQK